ncbi:MAG: glycosyltransferase family 2 protein [Chloroflexota bacterium]
MEVCITQSANSADIPLLSIVIPAFNEAERLPVTLDRLRVYLDSQKYEWEIIVVSNGSTDCTDRVVIDYARKCTRVRLETLRERGKGRATRFGALKSAGEVVFLCDADLSMPPETIAAFLHVLREADVVAGSREGKGSRRYNEPRHRHVMGRVFNYLVQALAVPGVQDTQCGFKAFQADAARDLFEQQTLNGFGFDVELLYLARKYGYRVRELGIPWYFDADTRVRPGIDTIDMLRELLMLRFRDARGAYRPTQIAAGDVIDR